jgi:hypothetical protein
MKRVFTLFPMLATIIILQAQSPNVVHYQAIARDAAGNPILNQPVSFRLTILEGGTTGMSVYTETHQLTTNQFGLVNLEIGNGTIVYGIFADIDWGENTYYLQTEMDPEGGTDYQAMGTSQFLSVPYSLYAKKAGNELPAGIAGQTLRNNGTSWISDSNVINDGSHVGIGTALPESSAKLDVSSVSQGFLPPRMTHSQINAIQNPAPGLVIYCTDCGSNGTGRFTGFMDGNWVILATECLTPVSVSSGTPVPSTTQIIWIWNPVPGAIGYKWNTTNEYATATDIGIDTTKTETGLTPNTSYIRYIWAYNSCGASPVTILSSQTTITIGLSYGGGIVFYIDATGHHGLIAAASDQSSAAKWGCVGTLIGTSSDIGTGYANTTAIVNGCSTEGIAGRICDDLVLNGYDDWFLPSIDELSQMFEQRNLIGGFIGHYYWSSSEYESNPSVYAHYIYFPFGQGLYNAKDYFGNVRAVRAF